MIMFTILTLIFRVFLDVSVSYFKSNINPIVNEIDNLLPQLQCTQCGYSCCRLYAESIINNKDTLDKCVPGGQDLIIKISEKLSIETKMTNNNLSRKKIQVAFIDENNCVGCSKCSQICPVDAIIGSVNTLHTVVSDICTGCNLCVLRCPTDCITMQDIPIRLFMTYKEKYSSCCSD